MCVCVCVCVFVCVCMCVCVCVCVNRNMWWVLVYVPCTKEDNMGNVVHRGYLFLEVGYLLIQSLYCLFLHLQFLFQLLYLLVVCGADFLGLVIFKLCEG